jgi:hypothetical protein
MNLHGLLHGYLYFYLFYIYPFSCNCVYSAKGFKFMFLRWFVLHFGALATLPSVYLNRSICPHFLLSECVKRFENRCTNYHETSNGNFIKICWYALILLKNNGHFIKRCMRFFAYVDRKLLKDIGTKHVSYKSFMKTKTTMLSPIQFFATTTAFELITQEMLYCVYIS